MNKKSRKGKRVIFIMTMWYSGLTHTHTQPLIRTNECGRSYNIVPGGGRFFSGRSEKYAFGWFLE